jgi:hypothetical protein
MKDSEILYRIEQEEQIAYGINDAALSNDRATAIDYYLGEPFGNEVEGRSQVVSSDVQDTIESALPQLLKVFVSGDQVVTFDPKNSEDVDGAAQETDYINHIVMEKNDGFTVFYVWFKDALLSKNGYVKAYYEEESEVEEESYEGLTDAQLSMLVQDKNVEVLEHTAYPDPSVNLEAMMQQAIANGQDPYGMQAPSLHDVKISVTETKGKICIKNVAPENIMVSVDTASPSLQHARFVQHREVMSRGEASEAFNISKVKMDEIFAESSDNLEQESNARDIYNEEYDRVSDMGMVLVRDTYIRLDDELTRCVVIGNRIVFKEKAEVVPFACITPMLMPHRHIGRSYSDLTMDIQLIKSTLLRGQLDNMYLANNGRYAISDRVNLDDMLTSRPGGIVRVEGEPMSAIMPLSHPPLPASSFALVEYMDSMKEKRTGVTAYNQGLDANSLNKTASGIAQVMSAAQQRIELVARTFAETGVKELFKLVHRLVRTSYTKPDVVRLRNKWVDVDPREWKNRSDLTISVGLGAGNKDQQLMHLTTILQMQKEALAAGITSPEKIYNALAKLTQNAGFKNPEEFWTNPSENQPAPPPKSDTEIAIEGQKEIEAMKLQASAQKFQAETEVAREKAQQQLQQEQARSTNDVQIEQAKIAAQMELERWKAELDAQVQLQKEQMRVEAQRQIKEMEYTQAKPMPINVTTPDNSAVMETLAVLLEQQKQANDELVRTLTKPKTIVRDNNGRAIGVN